MPPEWQQEENIMDINKIFIKDLKNYINKSGQHITVQESPVMYDGNNQSNIFDDLRSNITYTLNTNPNTMIKIIGDRPQEMDWFEDPGFGFRLIRIYLDVIPGNKRYRTVMNNGLTVEYHIERPQDNNISKETSLSLDMIASGIIKNIL